VTIGIFFIAHLGTLKKVRSAMNVDPSYPRFRQHSSPPQTPPLPPIDDTFLFVPHSSSSSSDLDKISHFSVAPVANGGEFPYLAYLGYKTLGWAIIFLAFLLILRFVKVWLLHTWIREADAVLGARISRGIEAAAASGDSSGGREDCCKLVPPPPPPPPSPKWARGWKKRRRRRFPLRNTGQRFTKLKLKLKCCYCFLTSLYISAVYDIIYDTFPGPKMRVPLVPPGTSS
jgi:hypothetical protein